MLCQVWAWYEVSADRWQLLFSTARRRYREFIALQDALEANPAYASSLKGESTTITTAMTTTAAAGKKSKVR